MRPMLLTASLLVVASVLTVLTGCKKEELPPDDAQPKQEIDPQVKELEEDFKRFGSWQAYREASLRPRPLRIRLGRKIHFIKDPTTRMKYFRKLSDLAFSVRLDATDPATRRYQLTSFFVMTDEAAGCAEENEDVDSEWSIFLRRLKIFKEEMQRIEAFFEGSGGLETFKGRRDDWQDYRIYVGDLYEHDDRMISKYFRDWRTAEGLTYERWHYFHSQFEEILGHKVEVWRSVLEKWEKERQKREAAAKAKEVK